jgi:histidine ammonia-lyase
MNPVAPFGSAIVGTVEDLQGQTRIKVQRARQAVSTTFDLLGFDLFEGSLWMDVRQVQDPARSFGAVPTAAWKALRAIAPLGRDTSASTVTDFLEATPASTFMGPGSDELPAGVK